MCAVRHLSCSHCLRALLIALRCDRLLQRRSSFCDERLKPECVDCALSHLEPGMVRGSRERKNLDGETEGRCLYCRRRFWAVFPNGWNWGNPERRGNV